MTKPDMDSALSQHFARKERIQAVVEEFRKKIQWDSPQREIRSTITERLQEDPYWLGYNTALTDSKLVYKLLLKEKEKTK